MSDTATAETRGEPELKRVMGPKLLLLFIVGDILGTGVYALTGEVAGEVGGAAWAPFLAAFVVATITAFSYLELVTKYPQAAGAALYTHKAFGIHFFTFLVAFTVMCSGITSASTASAAFASNLVAGFELTLGHDRRDADRAGLHGCRRGDQLPRRRRERQGQRRADAGRAVRSAAGHPDRLLRDDRGQGRLRRRSSSSTPPATRTPSSPSPPRPRWPSSPWSASRTASTWPRRPRTRAGSSRRSC